MSDEKVLRERAARQWDDSLKKKAKLYDKGENDNREMKGALKLIAMIGAFVLVASILFGGTPDLIDGVTNYFMTCR